MYCSHCGKALDDQAVVCTGCGVLINRANFNGINNVNNANSGTKTNVLAIVGFILSFFIPIAGLICSIIGYKNAPQYNGNGKGLALAGIIISAISMAIVVIWVFVFIFCIWLPLLWIL